MKLLTLNENEERIAYWDNLKFILILLVVIGHTIQGSIEEHPLYKGVWIFIYSFHMPLFIFVSGVHHRNTDIAKRIFNFVFLYIAIKIIIAISNLLINGVPISFSIFTENGLAWYMLALAFYNLISYLFRDINKIGLLVFSLLLGLCSGYDAAIGDFMVLSRTMVFYPFYLGGIIFSDAPIDIAKKVKENIIVKAASLIVILGYLSVCIIEVDMIYPLRPLFTGRNAYPEAFGNVGAIYRLLTYAIAMIVGSAMVFVVSSKNIPFVSAAGKRTIQVYTWHYVLIYLLRRFGIIDTALAENTWSGILLGCGIIPLAITILLSTSLFRYPTNWIVRSVK